MTKQTEALKLALEALEEVNYDQAYATEITAIREALADESLGTEQPAQPQQEPVAVDKRGSPCPEFWDWLPKAYNFEGVGNFTKYNMEVAFLAGMQTTSPPAQRKPLTDEEIDALWLHHDFIRAPDRKRQAFARAIEAAHGIKEKNNG